MTKPILDEDAYASQFHAIGSPCLQFCAVDDFNVLEVKLRGAGPIQDVQLVLTSFKRHRLLRADDSSFCSTKRNRASVHTYFSKMLFFLKVLFIFVKRYGNR